jgi:glycosyltransferase involved in cell wall biosynthesis
MPENVYAHFHPPQRLAPLLDRWGWAHLCRAFERLDAVTTPTKTAARLLVASGFSKPVRVISNGVDLERFHPRHRESVPQAAFNLPQKPRLLYVGRLDPDKHIDDILRALPLMLKGADVHLVIVGRGGEEEYLKTSAARLGMTAHITFAGFVPDEDLPGMYGLADCFLMAGTAELQSIATMEAMASGLPVVAADAMALPELVADGENGYLFPARDHVALADRIARIIGNGELRRQMSQNSLRHIQAHDIEKTVDQFEHTYGLAQHMTGQLSAPPQRPGPERIA